MKMDSGLPTTRLGSKNKAAVISMLTIATLVLAAVSFFGVTTTAHGATVGGSFDNVQVAISTSSSLPDYFSVSAYNMTGGLVASYSSQYPAAAFELPSGAYIFTVTASQQQTIYYPVGYSTATATGAASSSGSAILPPIKCCIYQQPDVEYGYVSQQVSGSTSLTISTKPVNQTSTTDISIKVTYPNGTAASGVYVSASVLGDSYGWAYGSSVVSMYGNTDSQGMVTMVAPKVPVLVSTSASIPIVLPMNQTTVQVTVAGQKVNVTAYWQPNYVYFSGQALIVPPQTSASIVLKYEPQSVGPIVYANGQTSTGVATGSSGSPVVGPATTTQQQTIAASPGLQGGTTTTTSNTPSNDNVTVISGAAAAVSLAALGVALIALRSKPKPATV